MGSSRGGRKRGGHTCAVKPGRHVLVGREPVIPWVRFPTFLHP
ncbi:MAG: hypothetical protein PHO89_02885 [Methylacidiphilaceae bacterium]|nr:hypothetical protein [Candidatus Methylacidiphilaceae bacterium]